ncbi:hypothetical protein OA871_00105 [Paracoccaceae bacterium]|nr:hypothetical protein [Paracoccaceae bacterium]
MDVKADIPSVFLFKKSESKAFLEMPLFPINLKKENSMKNYHVISYAVGNYTIDDIKVEIYYAPAVIEGFYSKKEIGALIESKANNNVLDGIFNIIKDRTLELKTFEIWHDVIEYKGIELIWKSFFNAEKNKMGVEVLYSRDNHTQNEQVH